MKVTMITVVHIVLLELLILSTVSFVSSSSAPFMRGLNQISANGAIFGVRGGGLFGGKDNEKNASSDAVSAAPGSGQKKFPAMTQTEVEEWMEHIPVFAVTDSKGAGVVLRPDNETSVFYFFLSPVQANATLQQLQNANTEMDLKISAFSLGKIWFNLLNSNSMEQEVVLKAPSGSSSSSSSSSADETTEVEKVKGVEYRLVPDTRDLLGARMLLTMTPEDGDKLKEAGSMTPELAQAAIKKAMTESPKFNSTYNEIPVFTIAQMRMQKQPEEGDVEGSEPLTLLPMYFSLQSMVGTWQQFMSQASAELQGVEPAINLMNLHDIVKLMQQESEIDWRHVVLVPSTSDINNSSSNPKTSGTVLQPVDPMAQMGGATLGDE